MLLRTCQRLGCNARQERSDTLLVHLVGSVHVHKGGLGFCGLFPPGLSSGKPCVLTLERCSSVATLVTSLYLVTSQARLPSNSLTWETGSVARIAWRTRQEAP
jgi:hypothetical protein